MSANSDFGPSPGQPSPGRGASAGAVAQAGAGAGPPERGAQPEEGQASMEHQGQQVSLHLPGTPDSLPAIRSAVVEAAEVCGFGDEEVAKIEMAVGEACTNIIEHAYRTQPLKLEIEVGICVLPDRLEITIQDYSAINFPIDSSPGTTLDRYFEAGRKRGLGLYIIRSFVDDIEHKFVFGRGNKLKLTKYFA